MKQNICDDSYPTYSTEEERIKAENDVAYKLAVALQRDKERQLKANTA